MNNSRIISSWICSTIQRPRGTPSIHNRFLTYPSTRSNSGTNVVPLDAISRRHQLTLIATILGATGCPPLYADADAASLGDDVAGTKLSAMPGPITPLDTALAACFTDAIYQAVLQMQLAPEEKFQAQVFKLRQREYKYYAEAVNNASTAVVPVLPPSDKSGMQHSNTVQGIPAVPDLGDQGGLLNNPLYFNFVLYILWKAALVYLPDAQSRSKLLQVAGTNLAQLAVPECIERAKQAASQGTRGRASPSALVGCIDGALRRLQTGGYLQGYDMLWVVAKDNQGDLGNAQASGGSSSGAESSSGTGSTATNTMQLMLLQPGPSGELEAPSSVSIDTSHDARLQIRLHGLADISGAVALQEEEGGFWGALVGPMLLAVVSAAGYPKSSVAEVLQQDVWPLPDSVGQRLYYALVDPIYLTPLLQATPTSPTAMAVRQDWTIVF